MIRKLASGGYRLYSRKKNPKTGRRRNLGTFQTRAAAEARERAVQYFNGTSCRDPKWRSRVCIVGFLSAIEFAA